MNAALMIATARRLARVGVRSAAVPALSSVGMTSGSTAAALQVVQTATIRQGVPALMTMAFSTTTKKPVVSTDGTDDRDDASSDDDSSDEEYDSDEDDEEDVVEDEKDEDEMDDDEELKAKDPRKKKRVVLDDDDWDVERWGALDSEDWQGFTGDLDAVTEEGVPQWLQSVRDLSAIHDERRMRDKLARRAMEEAKKNVVRVRKVDELGRAYGTGRRKTSTARVWVKRSDKPFDGRIKVNKMDLVDYFVRDTHREDILKPFSVIGEVGNFDVFCTVKGGGLTGQSGAVRHGIARALQHFEPAYRPALKKEGLLTRDPRMVERKKAGQKKARKKFQWVKR